MPRTTLSALQATIAAQIEADPWFAGVVVVQDSGTDADNDKREKALASDGVCITVYPVEDVSRIDGARGVNLVRASFSVWVEENPNQNQRAQNRSSLEAAARIVAIVTAYDSGPGELPPSSDSRVASLLVSSDGVRVHELPFTKTVQLS